LCPRQPVQVREIVIGVERRRRLADEQAYVLPRQS
jgi:hypothetical protein